MRRQVGLFLIAIASTVAMGQTQAKPDAGPTPCRVDPQPDPCGTTPSTGAKPSATEKFPFPGEPAASDPATPSLSGAPAASETPAAPAAKKDFPFPGDASSGSADSSAAGVSSSSSSNSAADVPQYDPTAPTADPALTDKGSEGGPTPGRHILHRVNPVGTKLQSMDERESEDLDIGNFYLQSGNLKGAYLRGQDAVKIAPDDPGSHYLLAETARKLNKRDEAIAEYNACLKLDPPEKQAKDALKALTALKP